MTDHHSFCRPSNRVTAVSPSATKLMAQRAAAYDQCVSLGQGVPGFDPPSTVLKTVKKALEEQSAANRYTLQNGLPALREKISVMMEAEKGVRLDPENELCVTVGGMEALLAAILTIADRGDQVLLPSPTYASYTEQVLLAGATPVFVRLDHQWQLDLDAITTAITDRTRAVILCNPGNPTGNVFPEDQVRAVCDLAVAHNFVIIVDEAYDYLVYGVDPVINPLGIDDYRNHVISIGSLSKKYCLTGWRVGWVAASSQWMEHIVKVHDAATICAPAPSQLAALAALDVAPGWLDACRAELQLRRDLCCRRLDQLAEWFSYVEPKGAFYVMAHYLFSDAPSQEVANMLLDRAQVITIPGGSFGPGGEQHLRLSFGGSRDEISLAFDRIEKMLRN